MLYYLGDVANFFGNLVGSCLPDDLSSLSSLDKLVGSVRKCALAHRGVLPEQLEIAAKALEVRKNRP